MKVGMECAYCLLQRAVNQVKLATNDPELQLQVISAMTDLLAKNLSSESVPSHIGTERDLLVQQMTGRDPYAELKHYSNITAMKMLPELLAYVENISDAKIRFRKAALISAAANSIEFDVSGRTFNLDELSSILDNIEHDLAIDHIAKFQELCQSTNELLYLMDNAGEIVFDIVLIREIRRHGTNVFAYVKSGPILNDATLSDAEEINLHQYVTEVRETGAAAIGVNPDRISEDFRKALFTSKLIIAKGMGNYESLTEFELSCPIVHIMRTKCVPVARHVGVPLNKNVVLIRWPR